jgi:heme/copper-type cytochrome/quinol oxidase subunit 4
MNETDNKNNYTLGLIVLLILVALLIIEFLVASINVPDWIIYVFGILQAGIILWNYMHLDRFFMELSTEDQEDS